MNEKVVEILKKIIESPEEIGEIAKSGNEFYFRYLNHAFSIIQRQEDEFPYGFFVYPRWNGPLETLASAFEEAGSDIPMAMYNQNDFAEPKARGLFPRLYSLLETRHLGLDDVFNDILSK